ncbi:nucleoside hydrolase [Streptomyces sp. NPDC058683]|uniref:nucleoside hydrolase n=1 Tax=Streptomyces sp. NPDC058683 TaxID=3346597 RepID=UPI0036597939
MSSSSEDDTARDLIIDTDTLGINDDALALHYLFALGRVPRLITTVFGNASAASSERHAHTLLRAHSLDVDVVRGCEKPLWWHEPVREEVRAAVAALPAGTYVAALSPDNEHFWGDGDGIDVSVGVGTGAGTEDGPAPDVLAVALERSQGADVLAIGPVTNIARALRLFGPSGPARHRLWISGGSLTSGNVTENAEFNAFADPEALDACVSAGWESVVMVPLEVLEMPRLVPEVVTRIRRAPTPLGAALDRLERESPRGESTDREPIWDVVAAAVMADKDLPYKQETGVLSVSTEPPYRGRVRFRQGDGAHRLVTQVDPEAVVRRFEVAVSRLRTSP